jgi:uncharacterized protein (TIGR02145 family)
MKRLFRNSGIVILLLGTAIYLPSCKKEEASPNPPVVATTNVSEITQTTALIQGIVKDDGGDAITAKGICWSTSPNPTTSSDKTIDVSGSNSFTSSLSGLTANTKYHVRAYATNSAGTSYGNEFTFKTNDIFIIKGSNIIFNPNLTYGTISDVDGNIYETIQIGNQVWMAENLKTTRLIDGTLIKNMIYGIEWVKTPAYSWYNNDASKYGADYGALYNWFTVNTDKLCPAGWHLPSDAEWNTLITYLGGVSNVSSKLMETGTVHWLNPNTGATNSSGFTGLPGGFRFADYDDITGYFDYFTDLGYSSYWWLSVEAGDPNYALAASISSREDFSATGVGQIRKNDHLSVRCVKNN